MRKLQRPNKSIYSLEGASKSDQFPSKIQMKPIRKANYQSTWVRFAYMDNHSFTWKMLLVVARHTWVLAEQKSVLEAIFLHNSNSKSIGPIWKSTKFLPFFVLFLSLTYTSSLLVGPWPPSLIEPYKTII